MDVLTFLGLILLYYVINNMGQDLKRIANSLETMARGQGGEQNEQE